MRPLMLAALAAATALPVRAQAPAAASASPTNDATAAIAVADSALAAISRKDFRAFTALMLPEAVIVGGQERDGALRYRARTREQEAATTVDGSLTERGFAPTALVSGPLAVVWMPYDIYVGGAWSHCGVDAFTMYRTNGSWRIIALAYSIEQPPACAKHPAGPPAP